MIIVNVVIKLSDSLEFWVLSFFKPIQNSKPRTSYSFISHDCEVGNGNFFSKAGIAGHVKIGSNNYFGIGSVVIPHTVIGDNNLIQAGMTIDRSVKDDTTVFYRFKEKVMAIPKQ